MALLEGVSLEETSSLEGRDAGKRGSGKIRSTVSVSPLVHPGGVAGLGAWVERHARSQRPDPLRQAVMGHARSLSEDSFLETKPATQ